MKFAKPFNLSLAVLLVLVAALYVLFRYFSALPPITAMSAMVVTGMLAGAMLFGFWGLFRSADQNLNLLLALSASIFAVGMVEVFAQIYQAWEAPRADAGLSSASVDTRSLAEVIRDRRKAGEPVYGYLNPVGFEVEGLTPISDARSFWCNESGSYDEFATDSFGFRNPSHLLGQDGFKPVLVALGGSFAAGCGVRNGEIMLDILRSEFNPATVNAAVGGSGPLQQYAILREYIAPFKPKLVLWFYFEGGDPGLFANESRNPYLRYYLETDRDRELLERRDDLREKLVKWHENSLNQPAEALRVASDKPVSSILPWEKVTAVLMRSIILYRIHHFTSQLSRPRAQILSAYSDLLKRAQARVGGWGGRIIIVYVPELARYTEWVNMQPYSYREAKPELLELFKQRNFAVIDLEEGFKNSGGDPRTLYAAGQGTGAHFNAAGNRLAANLIMKGLLLHAPDLRACAEQVCR